LAANAGAISPALAARVERRRSGCLGPSGTCQVNPDIRRVYPGPNHGFFPTVRDRGNAAPCDKRRGQKFQDRINSSGTSRLAVVTTARPCRFAWRGPSPGAGPSAPLPPPSLPPPSLPPPSLPPLGFARVPDPAPGHERDPAPDRD
jgi:hypothetical protein